ncbi:MAG: NAD(P)/FAD-dependent oxidoreductase [Labilithrix sp.]|nr:NAD(P)/FAD-dependent oxidoreductase [Labilithrix sp.]
MSRVDLLVVGGGPTGLAAAIYAATSGRSVVILEPRAGVIDKACGEGIMPGGVASLQTLGVAVRGRPFAGVSYGDAVDPDLVATGTFRGAPGLGVRRTVLHEALRARAAALGVRWEHARVDGVEQDGDEVRACGLRARGLVAADGLHSAVRRSTGLEVPVSPISRARRYGARRHYAIAPWSDRVEVYFGEGAEAYVTPVAHDLVGVAFLFEKTARRRSFEDFFEGFPLLRERLGRAEAATRVAGGGPFPRYAARPSCGRVLLAGDAAGYVDPLTGEGVALGMMTGIAAARSLVEERPHAYAAEYASITRRYYLATSVLVSLVRRRALHRPLLRLAREIPRAFDAMLRFVAHERAPAT